MKFDTTLYRLRTQEILRLESELKRFRDGIREQEQEVFEDMEIGQQNTFEEFLFEVKEGKRGLYPKKDWHDEFFAFCMDEGFDDYAQGIADTMMKKIPESLKVETLATVETIIDKNQFLRKREEDILRILGYREGRRMESVKIIKEAE